MDNPAEFTRKDTKIIKGVAICLMLWHHLFAFTERIPAGLTLSTYVNFSGDSLVYFIGDFGKICVSIFMFLSGYGMYISARSDKKGERSILPEKHIINLYKNVWMVYLIVVPVSMILGTVEGGIDVTSFVLNGLGLRTNFNGEWWFIMPYVILMCLFPLIKKCLDKENINLATNIFFLVAIYTVLRYMLPGIIGLKAFTSFGYTYFWKFMTETIEFFPSFVIGCMCAKYNVLNTVKAKFTGKLKWDILAIILIALVFFTRRYTYLNSEFVNVLVLVVSLIVLMSTKPGRKIGVVFEKLGEESTFMWLIHTYFCYHWCSEFIYGLKYPILIFVVLLLISFVSAKCIRWIYKLIGLAYNKISKAGA